MNDLFTPHIVRDAIVAALLDDINCQQSDDGIRVDTPFILQDGRLFQALLRSTGENGTVVASDERFAIEQVEMRFGPTAARRERVEELRRIATELHLSPLESDGELTYTAHSIEEAVRRLPILAQAVDRALSLLQSRARRKERSLGARLKADLRDAGFDVHPRAKISVGHDINVTVDYEVIREDRPQAALQVMSAATESGAVIAADRAVTTFHRLSRAKYGGALLAIYNEHSPSAMPSMRDRFNGAKPDDARLVAGDAAVGEIVRLAS